MFVFCFCCWGMESFVDWKLSWAQSIFFPSYYNFCNMFCRFYLLLLLQSLSLLDLSLVFWMIVCYMILYCSFFFFCRYLSGNCIWWFLTPTHLLPSSCFMCIYTVSFRCSLCAGHVAIVWCNTSRSSFCCYSIVET